MATDVKRADPVNEALAAFTARYGSCAIEAGLIGNLADHECPHGFLPRSANRTCACFGPAPKRGKAKR